MGELPVIAPGLMIQFLGGKSLNTTLPVATSQLVCIIVLTVGGGGIAGCGSIITRVDSNEVQPAEFVTLNAYAPEANPEMVLLGVFPVIAPGFRVQFPAGKPFNTTLPVATSQVGGVIVPAKGAAGVGGCIFITTAAAADETHPDSPVTVKLYVPAFKPGIVVPEPVPAIAPGLMVQFPAGKPPSTALPVANEQVGCVMAPVVGVKGVIGCGLITTVVASEVQPDALVTV